MVVAPAIDAERSHSEEFTKGLESLQTPRSLNHRERVAHLITGSVAFASRASTLANQVY